jgi:glycosyltransferase involved in cell wall biosynthesis
MVSPAQRSTILRLITRLNVGGPARQALLLTKALHAEMPTLLAAGQPPTVEGELTDPDVPVRRVPLVRSLAPVTDVRAILAVRQLLSETGATLLHTHTAKAGTVGRMAARTVSPRPRTVHTFHGHVLEGYFRPLVERSFVEIERRLAARTDVLIAISEEIRDDLLELGIGTARQIRVIPLGFDLAPFLTVDGPRGTLRQAIGIAPEVPLIGVIGRLVAIKDVGTLLEAMVRLPEVHLAVLGDGDLRPRLEAQARGLRVADRVHFTGWWADVAAALSDLDVVVLTSRNEGTPVSLIEASAAGRPVVATRVGGVPLVVEDGVTGFLAPPGRAEEIASLVGRLLVDPDARRAMGEAGRRRAAGRFSRERLLGDIRALYGELLGR